MRRASSCAAATASCDFKVSLLKSKSFSLVLPRRDRPRRLVEHEVAPVLLVHVLDLLAHLALEPFDARDVGADVKVRAGRDEDREDQAEHRPVPPRPRGDEHDVEHRRIEERADGRERPDQQVRHCPPHENSASRGSSWDCFCSSSRSSRSRFFSFFGTVTRTRASRSPRPEPFSFGAPLPLTRSSVPSCVPGFTLTETAPSGVGTSTVAPSAASENVTGTSTTRSLPRRSYSFEGCTRVTT